MGNIVSNKIGARVSHAVQFLHDIMKGFNPMKAPMEGISVHYSDREVLFCFQSRGVLVRRNTNHPEEMTAIRFLSNYPSLESLDSITEPWNPMALPFDQCDFFCPQKGFGWGASVYLWLCFGEDSPPMIPEPAWPEIRRFCSWLMATIEDCRTKA